MAKSDKKMAKNDQKWLKWTKKCVKTKLNRLEHV